MLNQNKEDITHIFKWLCFLSLFLLIELFNSSKKVPINHNINYVIISLLV